MDNLEDGQEEKPQLTPTPIYRCPNPECKAWVREEYATPDLTCPLCKGRMLRSIKHLPAIDKGKKKRAAKKKNPH